MATMVLSAAGSALGGGLAGAVGAAAGQFAGAVLGRALDERLLGAGAAPVEVGRLDRLRVTSAGEGRPLPRVWGRVRIGGRVIWASRFRENASTQGGGKGGGPTVRRYSYSVSLAVALCEGEISGVARVWADGVEWSLNDLPLRVYTGSETQAPDPVIEAVEGVGNAPAFRGVAYVVLEDLDLSPFGNRVPQLSFEVLRHPAGTAPVTEQIAAVALLPGSGEYALSTEPVLFDRGLGEGQVANVNTPDGRADLLVSLEAMQRELPGCAAASLVVSWFGDDLRCGQCTIRPMVEQAQVDGSQPWRVNGVGRSAAEVVPQVDGAPVYGGTPSDASVLEAIAALKDAGQAVMFYPFILMTQVLGNTLPDPWTGAGAQPVFPWRGRITTSRAPGMAGSPDGSAVADAEVAAFFGTAQATDFSIDGDVVGYHGPAEWGLRRFVLHYAALCAAAGGVEAFCIGSELRSLTQIRGAAGFPAVAQLRALASEVRQFLPDARIGYAADWSEYFGYHPADGSGDVYFHLDPLWADPQIDFIGIDNYMPLSDWRDGPDHADAHHGTIHDRFYLAGNVEGGEGYDWFYPDDAARAAQDRQPITDGAHDEPWVFRYKDIRNWWANPHHERIGGQRSAAPTAWQPQSKPIWFTEFGCPAVDKGTNQPNVFHDPKSSESALPYYSDGRRDDLIQRRYLEAVLRHWGNAANNPVSPVYGGAMVDLTRAFVWAWDARPYPWFPARREVWADGPNYHLGHWINGRSGSADLDAVVAEICRDGGVAGASVDALDGLVAGLVSEGNGPARGLLQELSLVHGFAASDGPQGLTFRSPARLQCHDVPLDALAEHDEIPLGLARMRGGEGALPRRIRLSFVETDGDHAVVTEEAALPGDAGAPVMDREVAEALSRAEARALADRWLREVHAGRDSAQIALPPSWSHLRPGDILHPSWETDGTALRVDRVERTDRLLIDAQTMPAAQVPQARVTAPPAPRVAAVPALVRPEVVFMDLPLFSAEAAPHAPYLAVSARPWPGQISVQDAAQDADYAPFAELSSAADIGVTLNEMPAAGPGLWDRGAPLLVRMPGAVLRSLSRTEVFAGGNLFAIGSGGPEGWELFQAQTAELIGPETWALSSRLRGQYGSDAEIPSVWPAGSRVVRINDAVVQVPLKSSHRGVERHYRIGPSQVPADHFSWQHRVHGFAGVGLRPYRPAHLRGLWRSDGLVLSWVRRTRSDGDSWEPLDVPLGEESETYLLRIVHKGRVTRQEVLSRPDWVYEAHAQAADGVTRPFTVEVAQISARFGAGAFARLEISA